MAVRDTIHPCPSEFRHRTQSWGERNAIEFTAVQNEVPLPIEAVEGVGNEGRPGFLKISQELS